MKHYLVWKNSGTVGIVGNLWEAMTHKNRPEYLFYHDFTVVSEAEYNETVMDLRFEDGEWKQ